jgi:starch synthase
VKVLMLYEYPPVPGGLATQGDLLYRGLLHAGVEAQSVHLESDQEKQWYYRWFRPDVVVGIGFWGHTPHVVLHPQRYGMQPVPWFVADGYIADYREVLNELPLILVTSSWVKEIYVRDGIRPDTIEVLPVGCDTDTFVPRDASDARVAAVREALGVAPDQLLILTVGGDGASKGAQEVMQALSLIQREVPAWRYVCKVWPQPRTESQNRSDLQLASQLGLAANVHYTMGRASRNFMPYLIAACDIYAGPSRLEGFGMPQVEAGACGKPVVGIDAMAFRDTLVHGETALLARVATENRVSEVIVNAIDDDGPSRRIVLDTPRVMDYRADIEDLARHLRALMQDPGLRARMGQAARRRVVEVFDYRVVARRFVEIVSRRLGAGAPAASRHLDLTGLSPVREAA